MSMRDNILSRFPAGAHALVLAHDPDGLLDDDALRQALAERGFRIVHEDDSIRLWLAADALRPWVSAQPVLIVTQRPLNTLPYDLWVQGHRVALSLTELVPRLSPAIVRALTPAQRELLSEAPSPARRLGQAASERFVLQHVYDAEWDELREPGVLLLWLNRVHSELGPLPAILQRDLIEALSPLPAYYGWPLAAMLAGRDAYRSFLQQAWDGYMDARATAAARERTLEWSALFQDRRLQDGLGSMVRQGNLEPLAVDDPEAHPAWARPGLASGTLERRTMRVIAALDEIDAASQDGSWDAWCQVAWSWADATCSVYAEGRLDEDVVKRYRLAREPLDRRFGEWLRVYYARLAGQRLPQPHHLCHAVHLLAHQRRAGDGSARVAMIILDGMALSDWLMIRDAWRLRRPSWRMSERLLLAQVPSITCVSRQCLVSGRYPSELDDLRTNAHEERLWREFWTDRGIDATRSAYARLGLGRAKPPDAIYRPSVAALCLIDDSIDELVHGASLGMAQVHASLERWLESYAPALEQVIDHLLERGYAVHLASDHGHVEAVGMGRPNEGILAETRGQRARIYSDGLQAANAHAAFPETVLWHDDGLLPDGLHVLMPDRRQAFAVAGERTVTHGGLSLDEMIVPFASIAKENSCP